MVSTGCPACATHTRIAHAHAGSVPTGSQRLLPLSQHPQTGPAHGSSTTGMRQVRRRPPTLHCDSLAFSARNVGLHHGAKPHAPWNSGPAQSFSPSSTYCLTFHLHGFALLGLLRLLALLICLLCLILLLLILGGLLLLLDRHLRQSAGQAVGTPFSWRAGGTLVPWRPSPPLRRAPVAVGGPSSWLRLSAAGACLLLFSPSGQH